MVLVVLLIGLLAHKQKGEEEREEGEIGIQ
jgi:hypothetical protein